MCVCVSVCVCVCVCVCLYVCVCVTAFRLLSVSLNVQNTPRTMLKAQP